MNAILNVEVSAPFPTSLSAIYVVAGACRGAADNVSNLEQHIS